jgi:hypothetical protein
MRPARTVRISSTAVTMTAKEVISAAGAVLYSVKSGRDLRDEYEQIRSEIQGRDMEALGSLLESRFRELQTMVEEKVAQAREAAGSSGAADALDEAEAQAAEAGEEAAEAVAEAVKD